MGVNIDELLALSEKERRRIAEQLWRSLKPSSTPTMEEKEIINLLENRWNDIESGKSKLLSSADMDELIKNLRNRS